MNRHQKEYFKYFLIILFWIGSVNLMSFISLWSIESFFELSSSDPSIIDNPLATYWLSPKQYLESTLFGFIFGLWFVGVEKFAEKIRLDKKGFGKAIFVKTLIYIIGFLLAIAIVYLIIVRFGFYPDTNISTIPVGEKSITLLLVIVLILIFQILFLNFLIQTIKTTGNLNLVSFITGRYHRPVTENRIFIFIDLRSSTMHAEKLGSLLYSRLIKDCFDDINFLLYRYEAEVYQYVGDEIVLTWEASGMRSFQNCVNIYFAFIHLLKRRENYYTSKYGILPEFKAGCNSGKVTATEVGFIKRDIVFHGDVLNTAARIQSLCNRLHHDLLASREFILNMNPESKHTLISMGRFDLEGKSNKEEVYAIEENSILNK